MNKRKRDESLRFDIFLRKETLHITEEIENFITVKALARLIASYDTDRVVQLAHDNDLAAIVTERGRLFKTLSCSSYGFWHVPTDEPIAMVLPEFNLCYKSDPEIKGVDTSSYQNSLITIQGSSVSIQIGDEKYSARYTEKIVSASLEDMKIYILTETGNVLCKGLTSDLWVNRPSAKRIFGHGYIRANGSLSTNGRNLNDEVVIDAMDAFMSMNCELAICGDGKIFYSPNDRGGWRTIASHGEDLLDVPT